jgi:hypothetical protein
MYCSSWVNTASFVKQSFFVNNQDEIDNIINSGIKEVFIDTSKGLDILAEPVLKPIAKKVVGSVTPKKFTDLITPLAMNEENAHIVSSRNYLIGNA